MEVECCYTVAWSAWCSMHMSFLAVIVLGSHLTHHSGMYILYTWVYMAICSYIYMFLDHIYTFLLAYIKAKGHIP